MYYWYNFKDIIDKFNEQNGKCFITNHNLTHICDLKMGTDNIWNFSIFIDSNKLTKENLKLVCHFIYTIKEVYNVSTKNFMSVYNKILKNNKKFIIFVSKLLPIIIWLLKNYIELYYKIEIFVKTFNCKTITLDVEATDTIENIS